MKFVFKISIVILIMAGILTSCYDIGFGASSQNSELPAGQKNTFYPSTPLDKKCLEDARFCEGESNSPPPFWSGKTEDTPGHVTEFFNITGRQKIEILMVVDSSNSMSDNLAQIGQNLKPLLSRLQDKDFKIAFTTADHGDHELLQGAQSWMDYNGDRPFFGKFMKLEKKGKAVDQFILTQNDPDYENIFSATLSPNGCDMPPYCIGKHEQPLRALKAAFERYETDAPQQSFFEESVDTVVFVITDEDERAGDRKTATKAQEVIRTFYQVFKGMRKRLFVFSVSIQDETCLKQETGFFTSVDYAYIVGELVRITGGKNISLCSKNYGQELENVSQIARSLTQSLLLEKIFYIPHTVKISFFPDIPDITWKLFGRKVVFSKDLPLNTNVEVSYRYKL